jgi:hypothetical protein
MKWQRNGHALLPDDDDVLFSGPAGNAARREAPRPFARDCVELKSEMPLPLGSAGRLAAGQCANQL